ncbi:MAG: hypothetical protein ACLFVU_05830 [Phycisphaerae bacterium]
MNRTITLSAVALSLLLTALSPRTAAAGESAKDDKQTTTQKAEMDPAEVKALIKKLSDEDYKIREEATAELKRVGPEAGDLVRKAAKDKEASAELKARCQEILLFYRVSQLPKLLAEASLEGNGKLSKFTRHEKKEVYVGAHSMRGTYSFSSYYMLLKELAVLSEVVPSAMATATRKSKQINWTLPVPLKVWDKDADKPDKKFLETRRKKLIETGQRHERTSGRNYILQLRSRGFDIPMPEEWKKKTRDDGKSRVEGRS